MIARYTVIFDREIGPEDGTGLYHNGSPAAAVTQLVAEIQEAFDLGCLDGMFKVVKREQITRDDNLANLPEDYQ